MATTTYKTFLMIKGDTGDTWSKLIDIKSYPDLGGPPNMLPFTTLSDGMEMNLPGIKKGDAMEFECNHDKDDYAKIAAFEGVEKQFAVWMGGTESNGTVTPTGSEGKYLFKGIPSVYATGGGVDEVRGMTVTIARTTPITADSSTGT